MGAVALLQGAESHSTTEGRHVLPCKAVGNTSFAAGNLLQPTQAHHVAVVEEGGEAVGRCERGAPAVAMQRSENTVNMTAGCAGNAALASSRSAQCN